MAKFIKETSLGKVLNQLSVDKLEIHFKTGISYGKIVKMSNNKTNLSLSDFYLISNCLISTEIPLPIIADRVFDSYNNVIVPELDAVSGTQYSKFGTFLYKFLNTKSSIEEKFKISTESLNKAIFDNDDETNAIDIYSLCKYFNQNFIEVMAEICSDLTLTSAEREQELRLQYQQQLESRKIERELTITYIKSALNEDFFTDERTVKEFITYTINEHKISLKGSYVRAELNIMTEQQIFKKTTIDKIDYYSNSK